MDFILQILQTAVLVSGIVVIVWLIDSAFVKRVGYRWRKALWLILAVRLLLPVPFHPNAFTGSFRGLEVKVDIPAKLAEPSAESKTAETAEMGSAGGSGFDQIQAGSAEVLQNDAVRLQGHREIIRSRNPVVKFMIAVWAAGALLLAALHGFQYRRIRRRYLTDSSLCRDVDLISHKNHLCRELGIKRRLPIRLIDKNADNNSGPMIFGYFKTMLLLPNESYTPHELDAIMRHELLHFQAGDLWYKLLIVAVCDVYWFNPVFRLMKAMAFRDVEYVCDEKAVRGMDLEEKRDYSNTILKTMVRVKKGSLSYTTQFGGGQKNMKERFENIFSTHSKKAGIGAFCLTLLMLAAGTACVSVTTADEKQETVVENGEAAEREETAPEEETGDPLAEETRQEEEKTVKTITVSSDMLEEEDAALLGELKKEYPEYEIVVSDLVYGTEEFYAQMPDMIWEADAHAASLASEGKTADITDILAKRGWLDQMNDIAKARVSDENGRIYGIPGTLYAYGLVVNVDSFKKEGLIDEAGVPVFPRTWQELAEFAVKIKHATGEAGLCLIAGDYLGSLQFCNIAWDFGLKDIVTLEKDGRYKAHLDAEEAIEAMQFVKDLKWKYNVLTEDPTQENYLTGYEKLANGTVAMYIGANDGLSFPAGYGMKKENIAMGAIPAGPKGDQFSFCGGSVYVFSADAEPEEIDILLTLLERKGLGPAANDAAKSRIQNDIRSAAGQNAPVIPKISVWKNEELLSYENSLIGETGNTNQALYQSYFDKVLTPGNLRGPEELPYTSILYDELAAVLKKVVQDRDADIAGLMRTANERYQQYMDKMYEIDHE